MNILVLHSDIAPDAPPEEQDTLVAADAVARALSGGGHCVCKAAFREAELNAVIAQAAPQMVFNLVEGVDGKGALAPLAPRLLAAMGMPFTGTSAEAMDITNDKPLTKTMLRRAGLATPDWSEPPAWRGLEARRWIVKSALEDASLGLDDGCVVTAVDVPRRAEDCVRRHGGRWFAEAYVEGREFNIAMFGAAGRARILPMAEMRFESWPEGKPRIVGYDAKWEEASPGWRGTVRAFGVERDEPALAARLEQACTRVWDIFGLYGFVRVDFRVDAAGLPLILEINANPCISPDAGFAAAGAQAGLSYPALIEEILRAAQPLRVA